ncbi:MAG: PAS domain S-box protein [Desulfatitalea sp.]|nr:PAS domain S-box protein [Desulfatitalea sp.]NNK00592.1 PAS domain S-box protein [Desulfatitalea sp.]
MESSFPAHYFQQSLFQARTVLLLAAVLIICLPIFDNIHGPAHKPISQVIGWGGMACPVMLIIVFGLTFTRNAQRLFQPAMGMGALVVGLCAIAMIMTAPGPIQPIYLYGAAPVFFALYTLLRLRFILAVSVFFMLMAAFTTWAMVSGDYPGDRLISGIACLLMSNVFGVIACYAIEWGIRNQFVFLRAVQAREADLNTASKALEKQLADRTAELTQTNQHLEMETQKRCTVEKALKESRIHYRRMVNSVTDYILVHDLDGVILEANYQMIAGLRYSQKELTGKNLSELMDSEEQPFLANCLARLRKGEKVSGSGTLVSKEGQRHLIKFSSLPGRHAQNGKKVYCLARDITEHRHIKHALAESQAQCNEIFKTAIAGMMIAHRTTHRVVEANPAALQMIGLPLTNIRQIPIDALMTLPNDMDDWSTDPDALKPMTCDLVAQGRKGIPILCTLRPITYNEQPHWIISFISIEKVKEAEAAKCDALAQLNRSQHLQAIGTLAGGISHDFNNILYGVIGYTQLALDEAQPGSVLHDNLQQILTGSRRAKDLIAQILAFSRHDETERKSIQPAPLVKEALKLLRASIPTTIDIQSKVLPRVSTIFANPTQLHQVVMNLCTNAAHAMLPQGGLMRVMLDEQMVETETPAFQGTIPPGRYVRLVVADTGNGMPDSILKRIFDPFFTTKPQGEGAGMGLSVVFGVVQAHEGFMRVDTELGKGSSFEILLPVAPSEEEDEEDREISTPGGSEHILFVDDENQLIQMAEQMLSKLGYRITTMQNPLEALEQFRKDPKQFDLVITDLTMPKLRGTKLARHMLHLRPNLPVLLCTGYGEEITHDKVEQIGIRELILKPILRSQLAVSIRRALEQNESPMV